MRCDVQSPALYLFNMKKQLLIFSLIGICVFGISQAKAQCTISVTFSPAFDKALFDNPAIPHIDAVAETDHSEGKERLSNHTQLNTSHPFRVPHSHSHFIPNRDLLRKKRLSIHS